MKKVEYKRPETETVRVKGALMGTVVYNGNTVSGGFNTTNQGDFDEDEDASITAGASSSRLWDEE